jgi:sugar lactone lactonase YvrE
MKTYALFFVLLVAATAGAAPLSVGGSYPTAASLIPGRNTCGSVTVQDNLTTVTHTPGAHTLSMTHAGISYDGTVDDSGNFLTSPRALTAGGAQYTITIDGAFTASAMSATVTLDVRQNNTTCSYAVRWQATKQGTPNSIPGEPRDGRALVVGHYAGTGADGSTNGPAASATFSFPIGLALDRSGNLVVAEGDFIVRRISRAGAVSTVAGAAGVPGYRDGSASEARFGGLHGIKVDSRGNIFVTDNPNHAVRKITPDGTVSTFVGNGTPGTADGTGTAARLNFPHDLAIDAADNLYVADVANHTIRKITPAGVMTTLAGRAGQRGNTDGRGSAALFEFPSSLAVDAGGNVWVGGNSVIRRIAPDGTVTTVAGAAGVQGTADGEALSARFNGGPEGLAFAPSGDLYISGATTIRRLDTSGRVTTVAGMTGRNGDVEGTGAAARVSLVLGMVVNSESRLFIADASTNRVLAAIPDNLTCSGSPTQLCLNANRFSVTLHARDQRSNNEGDGLPHKVNPIFGYFSIPALTGNDANPEVFVKVLDGRPVNGSFWVFYGGLTDLDYTLSVLDTVTGLSVPFVHEPGSKCGDFDIGSLPAPPGAASDDTTPKIAAAVSCAPDSLCLLNGRFRVTLHARDQRSGNEGGGVPLAGTSDIFGYFSLPALTGDANNAEVFLKILDGRTINGKFWVFYGGLTDLEYTITVVDNETGARVTFAHAPGSKCGDFNTSAF